MEQKRGFRLWAGFFILALLLAGCVADLKPAPSANRVAGMEEAARSSVAGVQLTAQVDEWPGPAAIKEEVTPVRIIVENNSGKPLRIGYNNFALVAANGQRFSALPPFKIEGSVEERVSASGFAPVANPMFGYSGFEVAPAYGPYYPGIRPFGGPVYHDPYYYGTYYPYWRSVELPTDEMVQRAVPEGVLNSGGRMDGYLYFEELSDEVKGVTFRADLVDAKTGNNIGEIRIPFVVD